MTQTKVNHQSKVTALLNVARSKKSIDFGLYQSQLHKLMKLIAASKTQSVAFSYRKLDGELRYAKGRFFTIFFSDAGDMLCRYYERSKDDFRTFRVNLLDEILDFDLPF